MKRLGQRARRLVTNRLHKRESVEADALTATSNSKEPAPSAVLNRLVAATHDAGQRGMVLAVVRRRLLDREHPKHVLKALLLLVHLTDARAPAAASLVIGDLNEEYQAELERLSRGAALNSKHIDMITRAARVVLSRTRGTLAKQGGGRVLQRAASVPEARDEDGESASLTRAESAAVARSRAASEEHHVPPGLMGPGETIAPSDAMALRPGPALSGPAAVEGTAPTVHVGASGEKRVVQGTMRPPSDIDSDSDSTVDDVDDNAGVGIDDDGAQSDGSMGKVERF